MRRWFGALAVALALATGCGNYGDQTQEEKGLEAIDNQEWQTAIDIFNALPSSPTRDKYLSGALAGAAGVNMVDMVIDVVNAQDAGPSGESVTWDVVAGMLNPDPATGLVSAVTLAEKIEYLTLAVEVYLPDFRTLVGPVDIDSYGLSDEEKIQVSMEALILAQFQVIAALEHPDDPLFAFADPQALADYLLDSGDAVADVLIDPTGTFLDNLLALVAEGVVVIEATSTGSNDLGTEMGNLLAEIGYGPGDTSLDFTEITNYVDIVLAGL